MAKRADKPTSNQPNREEMFQMAVASARRGQKQAARVMFRQVLDEDRENERAMLWLAKIASSPKERRAWLNRILDVNPANEAAIKALDGMDYQDVANRNRTFLRIGVVAYVSIVVVLSIVIIVGTIAQPV